MRATPGGEEADDEKGVRNYNGDPQGRESDRNAGVEEQGERVTEAIVKSSFV